MELRKFVLAAAVVLSVVHTYSIADSFKDPLDVAAPATHLITSTPLSGIAAAGNRLISVGVRGLIITSEDAGTTWVQRGSPVSSDLLAVNFPTALQGWAVGHDGVVLHSEDGGKNWNKQFDGRMAATQLIARFQKLVDGGDESSKHLLQDMKLNYENGPEQALLDVWFEDAQHGFICGSFGTLLSTADGGKSWQSRIEDVEYGELLHFNAIRSDGKNIYIASEKGIVFRFDRERKRFVPVQTGYQGSYFTLAIDGDTVVAAGLKGNAYRSVDAGKTWSKIDTGVMSTLTAAASAGRGRMLLTSQAGNLLISDDAGRNFKSIRVPRPTLLSGVVPTGTDNVVVVGLSGVQQVKLK